MSPPCRHQTSPSLLLPWCPSAAHCACFWSPATPRKQQQVNVCRVDVHIPFLLLRKNDHNTTMCRWCKDLTTHTHTHNDRHLRKCLLGVGSRLMGVRRADMWSNKQTNKQTKTSGPGEMKNTFLCAYAEFFKRRKVEWLRGDTFPMGGFDNINIKWNQNPLESLSFSPVFEAPGLFV